MGVFPHGQLRVVHVRPQLCVWIGRGGGNAVRSGEGGADAASLFHGAGTVQRVEFDGGVGDFDGVVGVLVRGRAGGGEWECEVQCQSGGSVGCGGHGNMELQPLLLQLGQLPPLHLPLGRGRHPPRSKGHPPARSSRLPHHPHRGAQQVVPQRRPDPERLQQALGPPAFYFPDRHERVRRRVLRSRLSRNVTANHFLLHPRHDGRIDRRTPPDSRGARHRRDL
mmetsp:Transcript_18246/g.38316  ORF Transcript_18246/g.38316 Transcript_18246/m.38316 type:complete len:223 (-) Transcript_18246:184-852(-)